MKRLLLLVGACTTMFLMTATTTVVYAQHDDPDMMWEDITDAEFEDEFADTTLFDKLGGKDRIDSLANNFVAMIMEDEHLKPLFEKAFQERWQEQLGYQLARSSGGEMEYKPKTVKETLQEMGLKEEDLEAVIKHLNDALDKQGVSQDDKEALMIALELKKGAEETEAATWPEETKAEEETKAAMKPEDR